MKESNDTPEIIREEDVAFSALLAGKDFESEKLYLEILQKYVNTSHESLELANAHHNLAQLYYVQGNYDKAQLSFQNAFDIYKKLNFVDGSSAGICCTQLAEIHRIKHEYSEAQQLMKQAINLCERDLGTKHFALSYLCLEPYAKLLEELGQQKEAKTIRLRIERLNQKADIKAE